MQYISPIWVVYCYQPMLNIMTALKNVGFNVINDGGLYVIEHNHRVPLKTIFGSDLYINTETVRDREGYILFVAGGTLYLLEEKKLYQRCQELNARFIHINEAQQAWIRIMQ